MNEKVECNVIIRAMESIIVELEQDIIKKYDNPRVVASNIKELIKLQNYILKGTNKNDIEKIKTKKHDLHITVKKYCDFLLTDECLEHNILIIEYILKNLKFFSIFL